MDIFKIYLAALCVIAAIVIVVAIVKGNQSIFDHKTDGFWWVISIGIAQFYAITIPVTLYVPWMLQHMWIIHISVGIAVLSAIIWIIAYLKKLI